MRDQHQKLRISRQLAKTKADKAAGEVRVLQAKLNKISSRERAARVEKERVEERLLAFQSKLANEFWAHCQRSASRIARVARLFLQQKRHVAAEFAAVAVDAAIARIAAAECSVQSTL